MESSLNKLLLVNNHVVPQIIKSKFVVCHISDIAVICLTTLVIGHGV